ncbi:hypothetical protein BELL_1332g00020 [Botrytis elliptica]|uniref:BRCT domain-containing protein n=1 Tax=Botrytis elliptica TaxID=278938 RepID=A0A4Z1IF48_9HELO|nr:hypothetical protein EAE99_006078 [Botrytis elliptica]TGO57700.1 hypothetical protein BELL_1332g00020 [Botrytis elliptica]
MSKPATGPAGISAPKPKMTAAQKKKADKEELLQEELRQARQQKQRVEESVQIDRDAKAKEDEDEGSDSGLIFNKSDQREHNDYWLAHQAVRFGKSEQLSKEQAALAEASKQDHMAEHTDGSAKQNPVDQNGESSIQQNQRPTTHQSTSTQAEILMQGTGQESDQSTDDLFFDAPAQQNPDRGADFSTLQDDFQQSNVPVKNQKLQTEVVIKTATDAVTKLGKPWAGSAQETSQVWIILNESHIGIDPLAHVTLKLAKERYAELRSCYPGYLQILPVHLRGGNTTVTRDTRASNSQNARSVLEENPLDDLPESEPKAVEAAPADWADREDETFLDLNHTKKKRKPRRKALPKIEDILSEIQEIENAEAPAQAPVEVAKPRAKDGSAAKAGEVDSEANEDDVVVVAGAVEVPKKAVKARAWKGKAVAKAVEVDSEAIGDDETVQAPGQAPSKLTKPRARKTKATDTIEVDPEVPNNDENIQGPVAAPRKVQKPRAKRSKVAKVVVIDSETDNDDDELEAPNDSSNQGKSQVAAVKKPAAKRRAVAKKTQAQDDEIEDDDVPKPTKPRPIRSRAASKAVVITDSDDDDDEEGQAKPSKNKPAARKVATKSQKKAEPEIPQHIKTLLNNTGKFLEGRTFVVSGTLPTIGRINIEKLSRLYGAKTSRAITKATTDVVLGENPLAKQVKELKELSPNTMDVDAFITMLMSLSNDNNNSVGADDDNFAVEDDDGEEEIEDQPPAKRAKIGVGLSSGSSALA